MIENARDKLATFQKFYFGGMHDRQGAIWAVELFYAVLELWFAIVFTLVPDAMLEMTSLRSLYWVVPHVWISLPFWLSSMFTLVGLFLYRIHQPSCVYLRGIGALIAAALWFVMFLRGTLETMGIYPIVGFYLIAALWQPRIIYAAWQRHEIYESQK